MSKISSSSFFNETQFTHRAEIGSNWAELIGPAEPRLDLIEHDWKFFDFAIFRLKIREDKFRID